MCSSGNFIKADIIKLHPLYAPILKLSILWSKLALGGEVDVVHYLSEALFNLKESISMLPFYTNISLPEGHERVLIDHTLFLIAQVFKIYQLRRSAQRRIESLLEKVHSPTPKPHEVIISTNEKKTKHDPSAVNILKAWLFSHMNNPYPTQEEKELLHLKTNLTQNQLNDWFVNARRRILKKNEFPLLPPSE